MAACSKGPLVASILQGCLAPGCRGQADNWGNGKRYICGYEGCVKTTRGYAQRQGPPRCPTATATTYTQATNRPWHNRTVPQSRTTPRQGHGGAAPAAGEREHQRWHWSDAAQIMRLQHRWMCTGRCPALHSACKAKDLFKDGKGGANVRHTDSSTLPRRGGYSRELSGGTPRGSNTVPRSAPVPPKLTNVP